MQLSYLCQFVHTILPKQIRSTGFIYSWHFNKTTSIIIVIFICSGLFEIWRFSVQRIYSGFKVSEAGIFFTKTTFQKLYGRHADLVNKCDTSVSHMLNGWYTSCDIWLVSSYLVWGRKCLLFPEHLISLPFGSSWFRPFIIYTLYITEFVSFRTMFTD